MHADAGRFRRSRIKRDQGTQKQEAGGGQETAVHDGCLHDFVGVAVGVALRKAGSTGRLTSGPARPAIFGIEPEPMALSSGQSPSIRLHAQPNVDFPALPPKAAGNPRNRLNRQAP